MVDHLLASLEVNQASDLANRLHLHSEGIPLVLVETLRTLLESGAFRQERKGALTEVNQQTFPVPQQVQDLIRIRLADLSEEQRRVLNTAAVIGRPFDLQLLRQVSGLSELSLLDWIDHLLARAFLKERKRRQPQ